jgi:aryl-alcohol dehydrogenase-like predicted oxidoreductase
MRLSTERDRDEARRYGDEARAIDVLHAAFDAGVTLLDTADAYCLDDSDTGHNERLIARALATWSGDRAGIVVATKGGLTRPNGQWIPDGRARHLRSACEASLKALGVERIELYQLHAPDSRVPLSTSVRALEALKNEGLVNRIGLCNVNVRQIEEARRITDIAAVQVEVSVWHDENVLNGVVQYCIAHGIQVIAYRPIGGSRRLRQLRHEPVLRELAERHSATPAEIALAWLADLSGHIASIPGPTRVETVQSIARAHRITLTADDRERLDSRFPFAAALRSAANAGGPEGPPLRGAVAGRVRSGGPGGPEGPPLRGVVAGHIRSGGPSGPPTPPAPPLRRDGEVVLIMGLPGAGKSTAAQAFVADGYARLNRDEAGGSLRGLLPDLQRLIGEGRSRIVLDNTYMSRASRARVVQAVAQLGLATRCVWLATDIGSAQVNAVTRIIANHGRLLGPDEMKQAVKRDISAFAPTVQFRHQRELEPPDPAEGFSRIDVMPFARTHDPTMTSRALIVWLDDSWWTDFVEDGEEDGVEADLQVRLGADQVRLRRDVLRRHHAEGWLLLGLAWCPQISDNTMTSAEVEAAFARMQEQMGVSMDVLYCPHAAGPPKCWCRKPLPGLGVVFIQRHRLDPARCIYVGNGSQDPGFARKLGFQYRDAGEFFGVRS